MNIIEVVAWKHPGVRCSCRDTEGDGILRIVEFDGAMPTQAEQDLWTQEYQDYIASDQYLDEKANDEFSNNDVLKIIAKAFLNHENRLRALEGKNSITLTQLLSALRKL